MGKWVDRALLTALAGALLYLLFLSAFGRIIPAACMSFVCCALCLYALRGKTGRMSRHQAKAILESWAFGSDEDARAQLETIVDHTDPKAMLVYLPKHPAAELSVSDVFSVWKDNRSADRLILATSCYACGRARVFSKTLQTPSITLLDTSRLIPLIRKSSLPIPNRSDASARIARLRLLICELPDRRPWYKSLVSGLGLMLIYLISGLTVYLVLATGMLLLAGISLRQRT